jgi:transposase
VISGIVHVLKSGCRWCDCPPEYGPHTTIFTALCVGLSAGFGTTCSANLPEGGARQPHR